MSSAPFKWYFCYVGRHRTLGDTLWVLPRAFSPGESFVCSDFLPDGYFAFYPATAALRARLIKKVAFCAEGLRVMPRLLRFATLSHDPRRWRFAEDAGVGTPFVLKDQLTAEDARIPHAAVWNHERLLDRLRSNWTPWNGPA